MKTQKSIAVIGGDARQIHTVNSLCAAGFSVNCFGLLSEQLSPDAVICHDPDAAIQSSNVILCPVPFTKDKVTITGGLNGAPVCDILSFSNLLSDNHLLISANIPKSVTEMCDYKSTEYVDLNRRDDFCLLNAVATAEGAIAEAVKASDINLHLSRTLVLGFGRCARVLAAKLAGLGASVAVCARRAAAQAEASVCGYDSFGTAELCSRLSEFDFIFNTVPTVIMGEEQLKCTRSDAVITDIASAPGGVDFKCAERLGIKAGLFLGLPGKYSPKSSGIIIADTVQTILNEKGV